MENQRKNQSEYIKIVVLDSEVESQLVCSILDDRNISYFTKSYYDTAYDGLFQSQLGWGVIRVSEEDLPEAKRIIEEWRNASPEEIPWEEEQ